MSELYGPHDDAQSMRTLEVALDAGIDFFDTADIYGFGHNEELLGKFLKGRRQHVTIATKFGIMREPGQEKRAINNRPDYIRRCCEASLHQLGVEVIDLYYVHRRDPDVPIEDVIGTLSELVREGKIRFVGLCEVGPETLRRAHAIHPITALQSEYSLWTRGPETSILGLCRNLGVTFVAYSPLGRAFLTGTVIEEPTSTDDVRRLLPRFHGEAFNKNRLTVEALRDFSRAHNATPAQIALAWLLSKHTHVVPIPGTKRSSYMLENAAANSILMTNKDIATLDELFSPDAILGNRYPDAAMAGIEP